MSIQSTSRISRESAIERIMEIEADILANRYNDLEGKTFETDHYVTEFINSYNFEQNDYSQWTNKMLEDKMDEPFFRFSMFDNYWIEEEE